MSACLFFWPLSARWVPREGFRFILGACLLYPIADMSTAGWVSTLANYMYPFTAGLACIYCMALTVTGKTLPASVRVAYCGLLAFATNHEQMLFIMGCVTVFFCLRDYKRHHRVHWIFIAAFTICGLSALSFALCPGTYTRMLFEVAWHDPDFPAYSMLYKAYRGGIDTAARYFFIGSVPAVVFFFLLGQALTRKYPLGTPAYLFYIPCAFPFVYQVWMGAAPNMMLSLAGLSLFPYAYLAAGIFLPLLAGYYLFLVLGRTDNLTRIAGILAIGLASRSMVGFSPVILSSGARVSLFADFSFILAIPALIYATGMQRTKAVHYTIGIGAALQIIKNILLIY